MSRRIVNLMRGNVIAFIALFIALGGTSYAATTLAAGSVGTKQLKKSAVTTAKIKNGAVTAAKIRSGAVTTAKLAANAVTGNKVLESSLAKVPAAANADHAANADDAATLGGVSASVFGTALSLEGYVFEPMTSTTEYASGSNGALQRTSVAGSFAAHVQLPQGATVTKFTFFYHDDGGAGTAGSLNFTRANLAGNASLWGVNAVDGPAGYGHAERVLSPAVVIDNTMYAYSLQWTPGVNACRLAGARIEYTLP